ncbi:MAG: MarC family protein, partial [Candidatus Hydrothermarchaeales archaeon]
MASQYMNYAFYSFLTLILIVDPIGNTPVFLSLLEGFEPKDRTRMIKKAVIIATLVLYGFIFIGKPLFDFIGVEMYSFKIAGGILLFIISIEMLFGRKSRTARTPEEAEEAKSREDIIVTP